MYEKGNTNYVEHMAEVIHFHSCRLTWFWCIFYGWNWTDDDFEPLVVTELPKDMFKKRRLVDNSKSGSDRHFEKPTFQNSQGEYSLIACAFVVISNSKYSICFDDDKNRKQQIILIAVSCVRCHTSVRHMCVGHGDTPDSRGVHEKPPDGIKAWTLC